MFVVIMTKRLYIRIRNSMLVNKCVRIYKYLGVIMANSRPNRCCSKIRNNILIINSCIGLRIFNYLGRNFIAVADKNNVCRQQLAPESGRDEVYEDWTSARNLAWKLRDNY